MKKLCLNCFSEPAINNPPYGFTYGKKCQKKHKKFSIGETIEQTTPAIKEERKEYAKDIEQRYVGGQPNKKYIQYYGTKGFTRDEVKKAVNPNYGFYKDS